MKNMREIYVLRENSRENQAGTDFPCFYDEKNDTYYEAQWNNDYGFPFGYWPCNHLGQEKFLVGDAYTMHSNACGIAAREYFMDVISESIEEEANNIGEQLDEIIHDVQEYSMEYNEETDLYTSYDGTYEVDVEEKAEEIASDCSYFNSDYIANLVEEAFTNMERPSAEDMAEEYLDNYMGEFDFYDVKGITEALQYIGMNFNDFFELGHEEGRIWPNKEMISFYPTEQPSPERLSYILHDLSQNEKVGVPYEELLNYVIVFEDVRNDYTVTACTISDYMSGNYGDEEYDDEEDNDFSYARQGKTQFIPHLASPEEKREYFQDFRNSRDASLYVPKERAAGSLARYHALRYPYGESRKLLNKIIKEEIDKKIKEEL